MEKFVKGDIVVLPFPFTDQSGEKKRPALIAANLKGSNVILLQITSKKRNDEHAVSLNQSDFMDGMPDSESFIMPSIIFTAESSKILYKAGKIKKEKIREVQEKLIEIFTN